MRLPKLFRRMRLRLLARLIGNGVGQSGATIGTALLVQSAFDRLITGPASVTSWLMPGIAAGLLGMAAAVAWLRMRERIDAESLGQDYVCDVREALFKRMTVLVPRALQKRSQGGTLLRFIGDLTALRQWVSLGLARLAVAGITTTSALVALATLNTMLAMTVAVVLAAGVSVSLLLGKRMENSVREARRRRSKLAANVAEKIVSMAVVQLFGQAKRERERLARQGRRLKGAMVARATIIGRLRALTEATMAIATGGALLVGAGEVAAGHATAGTVVAAMSIVALLGPPLRDLGRVYEYWHGARVSRRKLEQFLATPALGVPRRVAQPIPPDGAGRLEFLHVDVSGALRKFSAVAEPGKIVAIAGPNGAGKSTVMALAARFIDADAGEVRIDGMNIATARLRALRRIVGMVSPELPLLRGTIEKNLRYRCPDAPAKEIARVKTLCGIDRLIEELPDGADTRLLQGATNLSLGQRQRISLARAIVGNPRILLLDEADAHLDNLAAQALERVLATFNGTVLFVTHRPEQLARADLVWFLDRGRLVESGEPRELLNQDGATRRAYRNVLPLAS
ncbi:MAG: ABC transporter ATP-binding protein [Acidiferrobacterales bacterium]